MTKTIRQRRLPGALEVLRLYRSGYQTLICIAKGEYEIVSLAGTIDVEKVHLPAQGDFGGNVMPGCHVQTTLELIIGCLPAVNFDREFCSLSGYDALKISPEH